MRAEIKPETVDKIVSQLSSGLKGRKSARPARYGYLTGRLLKSEGTAVIEGVYIPGQECGNIDNLTNWKEFKNYSDQIREQGKDLLGIAQIYGPSDLFKAEIQKQKLLSTARGYPDYVIGLNLNPPQNYDIIQ